MNPPDATGTSLFGDAGRRHPIHQAIHRAVNLSAIVFVTVNTDKRKAILARGDVVQVLLDAWSAADTWLVGRYVVMPDHLHLFCAPRDPTVSLKRWMRFWKSAVSRQWPRPEEQPIWQLDFWDTQLRRGESYATKWDYVWRNPVRQGLVTEPNEWPHAGEVNALPWHEAS